MEIIDPEHYDEALEWGLYLVRRGVAEYKDDGKLSKAEFAEIAGDMVGKGIELGILDNDLKTRLIEKVAYSLEQAFGGDPDE